MWIESLPWDSCTENSSKLSVIRGIALHNHTININSASRLDTSWDCIKRLPRTISLVVWIPSSPEGEQPPPLYQGVHYTRHHTLTAPCVVSYCMLNCLWPMLMQEVWGRVGPDPRAELQVDPTRGPQEGQPSPSTHQALTAPCSVYCCMITIGHEWKLVCI